MAVVISFCVCFSLKLHAPLFNRWMGQGMKGRILCNEIIMSLCGWVARSPVFFSLGNKVNSSIHGYNVNIMFIAGVDQRLLNLSWCDLNDLNAVCEITISYSLWQVNNDSK